MRLKRFYGASVPEAMAKVRETLGKNAIILATEQDGPDEVTITAAIEEGELAELELEEVAHDLGPIEQLSEVLDFHRIPAGLRDRLLNQAAMLVSSDWHSALAGALDATFTFSSMPSAPQTRPLMLVGAPGAGKTAALAKLALHARLTGYPCRIVTLDGEKAGALEQITAFATALDTQVESVASPDALIRTIAGTTESAQVLIDTTGINPFDESQLCAVHDIAKAVEAEAIPVVPAGGDAIETAETALAFMSFGAQRILVTKVDAARRFGGILSAAYTGGLSFHAASASPRISEGLMPLTATYLADLLMPPDPDVASEPSAKEFAS